MLNVNNLNKSIHVILSIYANKIPIWIIYIRQNNQFSFHNL